MFRNIESSGTFVVYKEDHLCCPAENRANVKRYSVRPFRASDGEEFYKAVRRLPPNENSFTNEVSSASYEQYRKWLITRVQWSEGMNLPHGYVPETSYWFFVNGEVAGIGKFRHKLPSVTREGSGGHIGFSIFPQFRGKGYAATLIRMLVNEGKILGVDSVILTIEKTNLPSIRASEHNGAKLISETDLFYTYAIDV